MIGNESKGIVLQDRDRQLLRGLSEMRVIDRELAKTIGGFTSTTRVNVRLLALVRHGLLRRFSMGSAGAGQKFVYALTRKGAEYACVPFRGPRRKANQPLVADLFIAHQLVVNSIHVAVYYRPRSPEDHSVTLWTTYTVPIAEGIPLIPDGYFELDYTSDKAIGSFVEVDLGHENLAVWTRKVENYIQLAVSGSLEWERKRFRVLVIANSERRMQSLRRAVAKITDKIFWFATLKDVKSEGLFGSIWLRPAGDVRLPLVEPES